MSYLMASGDFLENLPLLFMVIAFIFIIYYAARHQMGVNSVFKRVQKLGNLKGTDKTYPGLHGILYDRQFNCYFEEVKSKPGQPFFLISLYISREIDANIVLSLGLKRSNIFGFNLPQKYFDFRYLPKELKDRNIGQLMYKIAKSKDFQHFVKLSIEADTIKYHHHFTGMKMEYIQNILNLLLLMAERVEKIGPVFRIKGYDY